MNLYELSAYLLPVVMLVLATLASLLPYLLDKKRRKKSQAGISEEEKEAIRRKLSYDLVASIPTNDGGEGVEWDRIAKYTLPLQRRPRAGKH